MLIDDWAAALAAAPTPAWLPKNEVVEDILSPRTQRYALAPLAAQTATDLARHEAIERSRGRLFAPAGATWIEWRGATAGGAPSERHGFLLRGAHRDGGTRHADGSIVAGTTSYVFDIARPDGSRAPFALQFRHDFCGPQTILTPLVGGGIIHEMLRRQGAGEIAERIDAVRLGDFLAATCALIAAPRLTHLTDHDMSRVNKARLRQGRPALLAWSEVTLNLDDAPHAGSGDAAGGSGVALHHVRAHLRLKLGRVETVRPHWRGDAVRGIVLQRHRVVRAEDSRDAPD